MCPHFWAWFFGLDAILICLWAFFRYPAWGLDGETVRVKTFAMSLAFAGLAGVSYFLAHTRLEWVP